MRWLSEAWRRYQEQREQERYERDEERRELEARVRREIDEREAWWASLTPSERQQATWKQDLRRRGVPVSEEWWLTAMEYLHLLGQARQRQATVGGAAAVAASVIIGTWFD
jgi:hypothetical protein